MKLEGDPGNCRSCGAEVVYCKGRSHYRPPYNYDGVSHFATCPNAASWRGKGRKKAPVPA